MMIMGAITEALAKAFSDYKFIGEVGWPLSQFSWAHLPPHLAGWHLLYREPERGWTDGRPWEAGIIRTSCEMMIQTSDLMMFSEGVDGLTGRLASSELRGS
jgi:hypothetical protein